MKVRKDGNSLVVGIPKDLIRAYGIRMGDVVIIHPQKDGIRLEFRRGLEG